MIVLVFWRSPRKIQGDHNKLFVRSPKKYLFDFIILLFNMNDMLIVWDGSSKVIYSWFIYGMICWWHCVKTEAKLKKTLQLMMFIVFVNFVKQKSSKSFNVFVKFLKVSQNSMRKKIWWVIFSYFRKNREIDNGRRCNTSRVSK